MPEFRGHIYNVSAGQKGEFRAKGLDSAWRAVKRAEKAFVEALMNDPEVMAIDHEVIFDVRASEKNFISKEGSPS